MGDDANPLAPTESQDPQGLQNLEGLFIKGIWVDLTVVRHYAQMVEDDLLQSQQEEGKGVVEGMNLSYISRSSRVGIDLSVKVVGKRLHIKHRVYISLAPKSALDSLDISDPLGI